MAKKDLTKDVKTSTNILQSITGEPPKPKQPDAPVEWYKLCISLPMESKDYLRLASYNSSSPDHIVSINQYIRDLVRLDMETHAREGHGLIDYHKGDNNGGK